MNKKSFWLLLAVSIAVSILAHSFFLIEWTKGQFMAGPNDGLSQMNPFKLFLYERYKEGNFFYSWNFGFGGGFYSQLAYYFSTSTVFWLTCAAVWLLEIFQWIQPPDISFWLTAAMVVSILRLSVILLLATAAYRIFTGSYLAAFSGAAVYALSVLYFRHVVFWEFFADAMLWLPILVIGIENLIRREKPLVLIAAFSLMLINNFYFAYINFIFFGLYLLFRWLIPLKEDKTAKKQQIKWIFLSGLISFCVSALFFIPAVYGFLNNERPPYEQAIPIFEAVDNPLFTSRFIILPAVFVFFLFLFSFYQNRTFRFFSFFSVVLVLLHFSPLAGSVFNGFSAPQYRWEYLLSFTSGGAVAAGLTLLPRVTARTALIGMAITLLLYGAAAAQPLASGRLFIVAAVLGSVFFTFLFHVLFVWKKTNRSRFLLHGWIVLSCLVTVNVYQKWSLFVPSVHQVSKEYLHSEAYSSAEQQQLIEQIKQTESKKLFRIDWMTDTRNNTPIVQDFAGTSLYSSIINEQLLKFYWHDLQIDMGRESVSRLGTLGNRANLHSLLQADYWIRKKNATSEAPAGFTRFTESEHYVVYKNSNPLPFVRTAANVFSESALKDASALDREHAMLSGIVLNKSGENIAREQNEISSTAVKPAGAVYKKNRLTVTEKTGGIDLFPGKDLQSAADMYVSFSIENMDGKSFPLKVNNYETTRKAAASIYKTGVNEVVIRVPKAEKISIRLPKGSYRLQNLALHGENYEKLKAARQTADAIPYQWNQNKVTIDFNNQSGEKYMTLPIPFEKGWRVSINGQREKVEQANYAWIGFEIQPGNNHIELVYYPPYFWPLLGLFSLGTAAVIAVFMQEKRRKKAAES